MPRQESDARQLAQQYSWVALALSAIAGCADAAGYFMLRHVYTSHMSGNSVDVGVQLAGGSSRDALYHAATIGTFFAGVVLGLAAIEMLIAANVRRIFGVIAVLEIVFLSAFLACESQPHEWMLVFPALAFGVQNAMLRRAGHHRVRTTYVTGMLTNSAQGVVEAAVSALRRDGAFKEKASDALFYGGIWLCFTAGGIAGAFLQVSVGRWSLLAPIAALAALAAIDVFVPLGG